MIFFDRLLAKLSGIEGETTTLVGEEVVSSADVPPEPVASVTQLRAAPVPVKTSKRSVIPRSGSYLSRLSIELLRFNKYNSWTIEHACAGTHVFGGNGSGKSSGSGQTIAKSFLRAGFGGLVLCAKPDERAMWERYAKQCGRSKDLIIVSDDGPWRFNFIQYELDRPGSPASRVDNLITTLMNLVQQSGRSVDGSDAFWQQAAEQLLRNVLMIMCAARGSQFSPFELQKFIDAIPHKPGADILASSPMAKDLEAAKASFEAANRMGDYEAIHHYLTVQFPSLNERTRSSVTFTLSAMLQDLTVGDLRELFTTSSNFFPEDSHEGAIIILDLPAVLKRPHRVAQNLFKIIWQQAALRRMGSVDDKTRPVFLWADEAQFFITEFDTDFQSLARSARVCSVYMTQNINAYKQRLGGHDGEHMAYAMMGYFQTQIFHANSDVQTLEHAQKLFGQHEVIRHNKSYSRNEGWNESRSQGQSSGWSVSYNRDSGVTSGNTGGSTSGTSEGISGGESWGYTTSTTMENALQMSDLTGLLTGSNAHRGISQAYIFQNGRIWTNGKPWLMVDFTRKIK